MSKKILSIFLCLTFLHVVFVDSFDIHAATVAVGVGAIGGAKLAEHHKKGTTNPANKPTHQKGQARRQRDQRGEKGDAKRNPNPNKRKR